MNLNDPEQQPDVQNFDSEGLDPVFDETLDALNTGGSVRGGRARRLRTGALLLSGAIVLACGSLFFLGKSVRNAAATTVNPVFEKVDNFITSITGESDQEPIDVLAAAAETDRAILGVLSEPYTARQVPLHDVQRNPFVLLSASASIPNPSEDINSIGRHSEARWLADQKARRSEILAAAEELNVKSIIMGAVALANVNGAIVRINDSVMTDSGVEFRIKAIGNSAVTAASRAPELDLEVEVVIPLKRN